MSDKNYLDPKQNPLIKTGEKDQQPADQAPDKKQIVAAIKKIIGSKAARAEKLDITISQWFSNDAEEEIEINGKPLEKIAPETINRILSLARIAEAEKFTDPCQNPYIKTDYEK